LAVEELLVMLIMSEQVEAILYFQLSPPLAAGEAVLAAVALEKQEDQVVAVTRE